VVGDDSAGVVGDEVPTVVGGAGGYEIEFYEISTPMVRLLACLGFRGYWVY
jgi:hypothetical protein